jgi:signal transduction histidine kinase/CheY-like chemotaxis protein
MRTKATRLRRYFILHGATRILLVFLGLIGSFFALSGFLSLVNINRVYGSSKDVSHTLEVISTTNEVFANILNSETRVRGFLLTRESVFLEGEREQRKSLDGSLQRLAVLISDNSEQTKNLEELRGLVDEHDRHVERLISEKATSITRTEDLTKSRVLMDRFRDLTSIIVSREDELMRQRKPKSDSAQAAATIMTFVQTTFGIALILIGAAFIQRELNSRERIERQVRGLLAELSEQNKRKDEFLATLSHELRNPLAPLTTATTLLSRLEPSDPRWQDAFQILDRQRTHLVHLVDELLDLSRIVSNKIELNSENLDMRVVLRDAIQVAKAECDEKGIRLVIPDFTEPMPVVGDQTRLLQVFGNLLNNACKFTPTEGHIEVLAITEPGWVDVQIRDTGRGIAPEDLGLIFGMFSQIKSADGEMKKGLGIGLTLAKRLVDLHGGELTVTSEGVGKGSVFLVKLPLADELELKEHLGVSKEERMSNLQVLVADDNEDAAKTVAMLIGTFGAEVAVAHDGEQAVTKALELRPNLILMDIGMPRMDGFEACRNIRSQSWGKEICIAALTGWGQDSDKQKTEEAGFNKHLVKPVSMADIEALLEECQKELEAKG